MFEIMQYDKLIGQMGDVVSDQIITQWRERDPDLISEAESELRTIARDSMTTMLTDAKPFVVQLWSKHFSEGELRELLAFYKSAVGRKSIERTPQITQETMAWLQQAQMKSLPELMARIDAAMEKSKARSGQ